MRILVETYRNGTSWHKVFEEYDSNNNYVGKWCSQGGRTTEATGTVSLTRAFGNTDYKTFAMMVGKRNSFIPGVYLNRVITTSTKQSGSFFIDYKTVNPSGRGTFEYYDWRAEGFITEA